MSERVLSLPEVLAVVGMKKTLLYELVRTSKFPRPIKVSVRHVAWVHSEVQNWLAGRIAARDGEHGGATP
jgi:prophage regulatory protein